MRAADLARLYDYGCWANRRLFAVVAQLAPDELTRHVVGSHGSVRNTLVHVLSAEWGWLDRCGGLPRGERLRPEDFPTLESILVVWRRVEIEMRAFLDGLGDDELAEEITFSFGGGPAQAATRGDLLQHAVIHAVHHRGQVALLLRELGHAPGNVDLLYYAAEQRTAPAHAATASARHPAPRTTPPLTIDLLAEPMSICRLAADAAIPAWATAAPFFTVSRTADELSVICASAQVPRDVVASGGWRVLQLVGPFDFAEVGVLLRVAAPLAAAGVSIMPVATYDTDHVLVRAPQLASAVAALRAAGHEVRGAAPG